MCTVRIHWLKQRQLKGIKGKENSTTITTATTTTTNIYKTIAQNA